MRACVRCVIGAGAVAVAAASATADLIEVRRLGEGLGRPIAISGTAFGLESPLVVHVGQLTHEFRNGTGEVAGINGVMQTYCVDTTQDSSSNWESFNVVSLSESPV